MRAPVQFAAPKLVATRLGPASGQGELPPLWSLSAPRDLIWFSPLCLAAHVLS